MPVGIAISTICLGVMLSALNFWAWTKFAAVIDPWVQRSTDKKRERMLAALYATALLWALCAGVLSNTVARVLLGGFGR